jgi:hypothetical protein
MENHQIKKSTKAKPCTEQQDMAFAYKYCSAHGLDILTSLHLKITPPNQFNDPFEFTPHVVCSNPARRIKRFFNDKTNLTKLYSAKKEGGFPWQFPRISKTAQTGNSDNYRFSCASGPQN